MGQMKTPGVYIVEKSAFPNSVVEVATAVPAFIGHTEMAVNGGKSLAGKAWRITSMAEFHSFFGGGPSPKFTLAEAAGGGGEAATPPEGGEGAAAAPAEGGAAPAAPAESDFTFKDKAYTLEQSEGRYILYDSMRLFFQNGGGPCYIVSVGDYKAPVEADRFKKGIEELIKEQEPTMVVVPEAVLLESADCTGVQQAALQHCGGKMRNRVAILDVYDGFKDRQDPSGDCVDNFRNALGINYLDFAAAYYPWVDTSIVQDKELNYESIGNTDMVKTLISDELGLGEDAGDDPKKAQLKETLEKMTDTSLPEDEKELLNKTLVQVSPLFKTICKELKAKLNRLPPSAAMAGVYTMVDNARGVWKAPANVSLSAVVAPSVNITHDDQEDLNVPTSGKSINAIRSFIGEGVLCWGARTLDGNSLDWRYINVRRTMIMLEESIRLASKAYVFEPNDANTWVTVKSMIANFLTGIWKRGGLAGAVPSDAFSVHVGLGETMTPEDILEGILRVTVLVAVSRPAEFIEITFQQQMQKS
ncbi:phage tail sheath family protein [Desulfoluna butyratoxydans]|uniref:Tail sheath protein c-terminal domain n=1 Tax=Desulfoluna butyratoxydans TaxID=231438 RepID=A0A4U8YPJ4_9BACT|nr:phage tail sheath family protein [Desulfoluna butyratoxydans]VFQ45367.1 tail sheath protein c-terminal domain [Desulfoluna butyratoxydans]